jgi:gamma-glutamyltranspeptidase
MREAHRGARPACGPPSTTGIAGRSPRRPWRSAARPRSTTPAAGRIAPCSTKDDFADFRTKVEDPVTANYRGLDVYKCGPWNQGPVFLQQLMLLEGFDLGKMGHNSTEYVHTVIEAAKLAYADREQYYGDPAFVDVPLDRLLSKEYAGERRA